MPAYIREDHKFEVFLQNAKRIGSVGKGRPMWNGCTERMVHLHISHEPKTFCEGHVYLSKQFVIDHLWRFSLLRTFDLSKCFQANITGDL